MKPLLVILGPTASGKTALAGALAYACEGEIISADSRQVFKRMNIGTGKDYQDYEINGIKIPYHLIDIKEPGEEYNVSEFMEDFDAAYQNITSKNKQAILCGGTGFYIAGALRGYERTLVPPNETLRKQYQTFSKEALIQELEKFQALENIDRNSHKRLVRALEIAHYINQNGEPKKQLTEIPHLIFGLDLPREERRSRIADRLQKRLNEGMVEEVKGLLAEGISEAALIRYGLEYKFTCEFLNGTYSYDEYVYHLEIAIQQFAKRQMTWFRKMEKDGFKIQWLNALDEVAENVKKVVRGQS